MRKIIVTFVEMMFQLIFRLTNTYHDAASKFVRITTRGLRNTIIPEDLIPLVQDVVETHPGLTFLKEATEFHSRYVHTVRLPQKIPDFISCD